MCTVDSGTALPSDLSPYDAVFMMMGMYTGRADNNLIGWSERTKLMNYLDAGGSVYFEGCDIGYSNRNYDIWDYTGLIYAGDGVPMTTGNVWSITGSLMCAGMGFGYPYKSEADNYIDIFTQNGGQLLFESQDGYARVGCYSGPSNNYRTITSAVFFSVFQEESTTRQELMAVYMEFLTGGTGTAEQSGAVLPAFSITATNPATDSFSVTLVLPVSTVCNLGLFDITGRRVGTVASGIMSSGTHNLMVSGAEISSGAYMISGTVAGEHVSLRSVLVK